VVNAGVTVYELKVRGLEARFFGGVAPASEGTHSTKSGGKSHGSGSHSDSDGEQELGTMVGEGLKYKEDTFLTSANLCRWVIDFQEVQLGKQVGMGSYGVVYRGRWKGVEVAVKRFINQKLDERRLLEFRSEMAFLSELHHPNIVLFIGTCANIAHARTHHTAHAHTAHAHTAHAHTAHARTRLTMFVDG
jgi:hypothetical protein